MRSNRAVLTWSCSGVAGGGPAPAAELLLDRVRAGMPTTLVVAGGPRTGKTSLLRYGASAATGFEVRRADAAPCEQVQPNALLTMIVLPLMIYAAALAPLQRRAVRAALSIEEPVDGTSAAVGFALMNLLLVAAHRRPQLLVIDDVQWADAVSLHALAFALRRIEGAPVGAILAGSDAGLGDLAAAGLRPMRLPAAGPVGRPDGHRLTPQEVRVGMAVASGLSNGETAAALFISVKTVEYHLGAAYRKLGLSTRTQLARHPAFLDAPDQLRASRASALRATDCTSA